MGFGTVYSIICNETGEVYVGTTAIGMNQRISGHISNCKRYDEGKQQANCSSFDIIRRGNYKITVLEHLEFTHKSELHQRASFHRRVRSNQYNAPTKYHEGREK